MVFLHLVLLLKKIWNLEVTTLCMNRQGSVLDDASSSILLALTDELSWDVCLWISFVCLRLFLIMNVIWNHEYFSTDMIRWIRTQ